MQVLEPTTIAENVDYLAFSSATAMIMQNDILSGVGSNDFCQYGNSLNVGLDKFYPSQYNISDNFGTLSKSSKVSNVHSIKFGNTEAKFTVLDDSTIKLTVPANTNPGKVAITITDNDGKTTTLNNAYEYMADKGDDDGSVDKDNNNHVIPTVPNTGL